MVVRLITSEKGQRRNQPSLALSYKLKRGTLNNHAVDLLIKNYGSDFEYIQFLIDDERPGIFWIKPATKDAPACKRVDAPSPKTRNFSISVLLTELKWQMKETSRYSIEWDPSLQAGIVDTSKRLDSSDI